MNVAIAVLSAVLSGVPSWAAEIPRVGPEVCEYARLSAPDFVPPAGSPWEPATDLLGGARTFSAKDGPSFTARVYRRRDTGELAIAFAGSAPGALESVAAALSSGTPGAFPSLYDRAREFVSEVMKLHDGPIVVTGHSLGGGLADYVGWTRGVRAAAFNPIGLTRKDLDELIGCGRGGTCRGDDVRVMNYVVAGEFADARRRASGGGILGQTLVFDFRRKTPLAAHALAPFLRDLQASSCRAEPAAKPVAAATAGAAGVKTYVEWVTIPGGSFVMGAARSDEGPPHPVTVKTFRMAKSAVTNAQYQACVDEGACSPADDCENRNLEPDHPVVCVDWAQSNAFARWVGGRLPTEAEWEYAARSAGKERAYPWGDQPPDCSKAAIAGCGNGTAPVCSKPAGNTDQGLCDMAGNTWAWVQDAYHESYKGAPANGDKSWEKSGERFRVFRGGSFLFDATYARSTQRRYDVPETRCGRVGFRPVRD